MKDRALVAKRMKQHVQDPETTPLLIFPEGTCVNNEYCVMFKRGAFDLGAVVCPVAIKYNKIFVDAFWNSKRQSFTAHIVRALSVQQTECEWHKRWPCKCPFQVKACSCMLAMLVRYKEAGDLMHQFCLCPSQHAVQAHMVTHCREAPIVLILESWVAGAELSAPELSVMRRMVARHKRRAQQYRSTVAKICLRQAYLTCHLPVPCFVAHVMERYTKDIARHGTVHQGHCTHSGGRCRSS